MASSNWRKFWLLLWKNFLLQKRQRVVTILEIVLPVMLSIILVIIRQTIKAPRTETDPRLYPAFDIDQLPAFSSNPPDSVFYAPKNEATDEIINATKNFLNLKFVGYKSEEKMLSDIASQSVFPPSLFASGVPALLSAKGLAKHNPLAGIVFDGINDANWKIDYRLRFNYSPRNNKNKGLFSTDKDWKTNFVYPLFQKLGPREEGKDKGGDPGYWREGFLTLQYALNKGITEYISSKSGKAKENNMTDIDVKLKRIPYPPYTDDIFVTSIQLQFPLIFVMSLVIVVLDIVKNVTVEKDRKLKESMKIMGLSNWMHWAAWFSKCFLFVLLIVTFITILLTAKLGPRGSVIPHSDPSCVFMFLLLYGTATINFSFMVSTFFKKANSAAAAAGVLWFITYLPYGFIQPRYATISYTVKIVTSLLLNVNMAYGCQVMGMFEGKGGGLQWATLSQASSVDDNFSMQIVMVMLVVDFFLYATITWYVEGIAPGELGVPQKWYFPVSPSYWFGPRWKQNIQKKINSREILENSEEVSKNESDEYFEKNPIGLNAGIQMKNLRKVFGSKIAVKNTSIDMFEGQITVLLGHNGAGKSTTMSVLTGQYPPTSGFAIINGFDIRNEMDDIRHSIGLCPQHDVLFDSLTVYEHLVFFGELKGNHLEKVTLDLQINQILKDLNLETKKFSLAKNLSGGMKRKLSVGIALIGNPKVVMLDEPTSGMDPSARRQTWDVLLKYKQGRTVLLTTHFMDEADVLGNRIAIMSNGVMKCCGSSLFLKSKYGAGYHMVIVKENTRCDVSKISRLICHHVPQAQLESNISAELSYILPKESSSSFAQLFSYLEANKKGLGIMSYGASITTMEEVFMRVGEEEDETLTQKIRQTTPAQNDTAFENPNFEVEGDTNHTANSLYSNQRQWITSAGNQNFGLKLYFQQFYAMFLKRVLHTKRNWLISFAQLIIPAFYLATALLVMKTFPKPGDLPPMPLNLEKFSYTYNAYTSDKSNASLLNIKYADQFRNTKDNPVYVKNDHEIQNKTNNTIIDEYLVEIAASDGVSYLNDHYIVGALFSEANESKKAIGFFNDQAFHTPAISLEILMNSILSYIVDGNFSALNATNHPLPRTARDQVLDEQTRNFDSFVLSFNLMFGMCFLSSSFAVFLIRERVSKAKHIQIVAGVHFVNFWLSTFLWDFINFLIPTVLVVLVFLPFDIQAYLYKDNLAYVFLLLFCYAFAQLPMVYLFSFVFDVPTSGFVKLVMFNIFTGVVTLLTNAILSIPDLGTQDEQIILEWIFLLFPGFALGQGLNDVYNNYNFNKTCHDFLKPYNISLDFFCALMTEPFPCCQKNCGDMCAKFNDNYLSWEKPGIGREVFFLCLASATFFSILMIYESQVLRGTFYSIRGGCRNALRLCGFWERVRPQGASEPTLVRDSRLHGLSRLLSVDEDVNSEKLRIENMIELNKLTDESNAIILDSLTKKYGEFLAVNELSLAIPKGECFGLLGVNGAGKTTTFKMLTGDETITDGNGYVGGYDIKSNLRRVQQRMGYCPQFDALIDQMTGWETLTMYARLKGIKENMIPDMIKHLVSALLLEEHIHKYTKNFSGGNKRKLSTAIALVGSPDIVLLDEPTTGMDPVARRLLWDTLSSIRERGNQSIILTSHSMDECEALCTRMAIMVNGIFKCIGSCQHLKNKFGNGYTVMARIGQPTQTESVGTNGTDAEGLARLMEFLDESFPGAQLKDEHQGLIHYWIPETSSTSERDVSWAEVFDRIESAREEFNIEDYSVSQTTLEQVFLNFARNQNAENKSD